MSIVPSTILSLIVLDVEKSTLQSGIRSSTMSLCKRLAILKFVVFENATDEKLKNSALAGIVMNLAALRRNEEAKKYAEMYFAEG